MGRVLNGSARVNSSLEDRTTMDEGTPTGAEELARLREENVRLRQQLELNRTAHHYLERLAHRFSGEDASLESPEQIQAFCQRIVRSVEILVQEFKELLSGRRKFQEDFGLLSVSTADRGDAPTRAFRKEDLHGDLGRRLFDWRTTSVDDESFKEMKSAIDELKYHQLALLAGYERCSREGTLEILKSLDPDTIRAEVIGRPEDSGGATLRRWNPFLNLRLWSEYKRRYQGLVTEDVGRFEDVFRTVFRGGYREAMRAKTMSRQPEQRSSGKGDR